MPKLDPEDLASSSTTVAPAPLPAGQTSGASSGFGTTTGGSAAFGASTTATTGGFGATSGFGASTSGSSSFGSSAGGFGGTSGGGFGGASSFGGASAGGFGGGMSGGGMGMGGGMNGMPQQSTAEASAAFGGIMAAQAASGAPEEHWMKTFWRPAMGWLYMLICFMDFCVFPMLSMFLPVIERMFGLTMGYVPWQSLTLSNGGLIHLAFGAILGVSAYGRTQEKKTGTS